jgi:hypothetical protein
MHRHQDHNDYTWEYEYANRKLPYNLKKLSQEKYIAQSSDKKKYSFDITEGEYVSTFNSKKWVDGLI